MARWRCPHRTVALLVLMPALVLGGCPFAALQQALSGGAPGAFEEAAATVSRRLMAKVSARAAPTHSHVEFPQRLSPRAARRRQMPIVPPRSWGRGGRGGGGGVKQMTPRA